MVTKEEYLKALMVVRDYTVQEFKDRLAIVKADVDSDIEWEEIELQMEELDNLNQDIMDLDEKIKFLS